MSKKKQTREEWLEFVVNKYLRPLFQRAGYTVPEKIRVTCGFPSQGALGTKKRRVGECWSEKCSRDQTHEIIVSPVLVGLVDVVETLAHEVVHATVGVDKGHKAPFRRCCAAVGLTKGKPTNAGAGEELVAEIQRWKLPPYPHAELVPGAKEKKQGTRLLKCECADCGYTVRVTRKWLEEAGAPLCPCNEEAMEAA